MYGCIFYLTEFIKGTLVDACITSEKFQVFFSLDIEEKEKRNKAIMKSML